MSRRVVAMIVVLCVLASVVVMAAPRKSAEVLLGGKVVIRFDRGMGKQSAMDRAKFAATKLNAYLAKGSLQEFNIVAKKSKGLYVVSAGKFMIASIDANTAYKDKKTRPRWVALGWAKNIREVIKQAKLNKTTGSLKAGYQ
jgi:hypothetical protein